MKNLILVGAACLAASSTWADLGDTYAQSCTKFGGKGIAVKRLHEVAWHLNNAVVLEAFVKNECVFMRLVPDKGVSYTTQDVQRLLVYNSGSKQIWTPFPVDTSLVDIAANWSTTDGLVIATLYTNGCVQFAYKWYAEAKGLLAKPAPEESAPVEDSPSIKYQQLNPDGTIPSPVSL